MKTGMVVAISLEQLFLQWGGKRTEHWCILEDFINEKACHYDVAWRGYRTGNL